MTENATWDELARALPGKVHLPGTDGYRVGIAGFNLALPHSPAVVVAATSTEDVQVAVRAAAKAEAPVRVMGAGHGERVIAGGVLVAIRGLNSVSVDALAQTATFGGGVRWLEVIQQTAPHGLAPITGSAPNVGAIGFLVGGGIGPLVRQFGAGSDYLLSATIVTGTGDVLTANAVENPDLFWAMRGGKWGFGIVTEATIRLVAIPKLYAGALVYAEEQMETMLRFWQQWTRTAPEGVTTSVALANLPPLDFIPEPLRGRRVLMLRFAYVGDVAEGERLAAPFRSAAPVYLDGLFPMPLDQTGRIHNDPEGPMPAWIRGHMVTDIDDAFCTEVLKAIDPAAQSPFLLCEVRHVGGPLDQDVPEGTAVGGRGAQYTVNLIAANPPQFGAAKAAAAAFLAAVSDSLAEVNNINFAGNATDDKELAACWTEETRIRLAEVCTVYDPSGVFS